MIEDGLFGGSRSRRHEWSTLNQTGIIISVDPTVTETFVHTCIPFNSLQDISSQKKYVMCLEEVRKKSTSVYCGLCNILSHRETDRNPSRHDYCMGGE